MTTFHLACLSGSSNTVNTILNYVNGKEFESSFLSMKSATGMNAFHYACMNWTSDVLLTLLQSGKYDNFKENDNFEDFVGTRQKFYKNDLNEDSDDKLKPLHISIMTGLVKNVDLILNYRLQALQAEQQKLIQIKQIEQAQKVQKLQESEDENQLSKTSQNDRNLQNLTLFIQKTYSKKSKKILANLPQSMQIHQLQIQNEKKQNQKKTKIQSQQKIEEDPDFLRQQSIFRKKSQEISKYAYIVNSSTQKMNKTPLMIAVQYGNTEIVSFLIKQKLINLNLKDIVGRTALHITCIHGFTEIARILLHKKGIVVNEPSSEGMTSLHYACMKGHPEIVSLLLKFQNNEQNDDKKFNVDVNVQTPWTLEAPIHLTGSAAVLNVLIEEGQNLNLNATNRNGMSALHIACKSMNHDVASILIKKGQADISPEKWTSAVEVNLQDKSGKTPLHYACLNSDFDVVKSLLQINGIKINLADNDGITPIRAACFNPDHNLIDLLMARQDLILSEEDKEIVEKAKEIKV